MIQPCFRLILAIILLLAFGSGYNKIIARCERKGYLEGFHWLACAIGMSFSLAILAIIDWHSAILAASALFISGLPLALGEIWRYMRARERGQRYVRQTETLAE